MTHYMQQSIHDETQNKQILFHLEKYGQITSIEAITKYRITRLAEIIRRLKVKGNAITSTLQFDENNKSRHWSKYQLTK